MRLPKGHKAQIMGQRSFQTMYTAEQMKAYAASSVANEREACAKVVEQIKWSNWFQSDCVAAIRARGQV